MSETGSLAQVVTGSADETRDLGRRLAEVLRAGDVVVLSGDLGAGKTTLAQGVGAGLGVRGDVTSPTFVISRVHPSLVGGPALVHVDAYRLGGGAELEDLDLEETLEAAVTLVEWGDGVADDLSPDRLRVHLSRRGADLVAADAGGGAGLPLAVDPDVGPDPVAEVRVVTVEGTGPRWASVPLRALLGGS